MNAYSIIQKSQLEGANRLDAEYYQSEYLEYKSQLLKLETKPLDALTDKIDVGFVSSMTGHFQESGVPLLRTQNVKPFYPDLESDIVYVDEEFHKKLKKSQIFPRQVLLARSGSIGDACIVPDNFPVSNSADIILITPSSKVQPEYLTAFINSKYGQFQIDRASSGGLQGHMNLFSLEKLLVPLPNDNLQKQVAQTVRSGLIELKNSQKYYSQAENLLLEELGLKDFQYKDDLSFIVNLSDAKAARRVDAEFFQPKYDKLFKISKTPFYSLGDITTFLNHGKQPPYAEERNVPIITQRHLGQFSPDIAALSDEDTKQTTLKWCEQNQKYQLKRGDLLYYSVGAYIGKTNVILEDIGKIVPAGFLTLIRTDENRVDPVYLTVVLNSAVGQLQSEKWQSATAQSYIYPKDIRNFKIPVLPMRAQQKIADLVRQSHAARKKSKELLEQAKREVEEMIEKTI